MTVECYVTSNMKYYFYHIIIFMMFIMTIIEIQKNNYKNITGFILSSNIIQILLFCCINVYNKQETMTTCDMLFVGYSNIAHILIISIYILINMKDLEDIKQKHFAAIYILCLLIYNIVVVVIVNNYYFSGGKFIEYYCKCNSPTISELPIVNLPALNVSLKNVRIVPNKTCKICYLDIHKIIVLECKHKLCEECKNQIEQKNSNGDKLCPWCRDPIIE